MWKKGLDDFLITTVYAVEYAWSFCINLLYFLFGYVCFQLLRTIYMLWNISFMELSSGLTYTTNGQKEKSKTKDKSHIYCDNQAIFVNDFEAAFS